VLVNSNPATIMTDPEFADRTYVEPITPEVVEKIIVRELEEMKRMGVPVDLIKGSAPASGAAERASRLASSLPDKLVLLPTLGGQTALNTAMARAFRDPGRAAPWRCSVLSGRRASEQDEFIGEGGCQTRGAFGCAEAGALPFIKSTGTPMRFISSSSRTMIFSTTSGVIGST